MKRRFVLTLFFLLTLLLFPLCSAATVTIDQNVQYQTIIGWGDSALPGGIGLLANGKQLYSAELYSQILDDAVNNFGFTSSYAWPTSAGSWEPYNDNEDPYTTNSSAFITTGADEAGRLAVEMKQRVEANGEPYTLLVRSSYGVGYIGWLTESPGEYTEEAISYMTYLRNTYGVDVDYWIIVNEPGAVFPASPTQIATTAKTLAPAIQAAGFPTKIMFPEGANSIISLNYITALQNDAEFWNYVGLLTWHLYPAYDPQRSQIYNFAKQKGIPTGQTESALAPVQSLYNDLTEGGVSYWTPAYSFVGAVGSNFLNSGTLYGVRTSLTTFDRSPEFYKLRQVIKYARPGAVRIEATSDDSKLLALAFRKNGKVNVVLINNGTSSISTIVNSLPSGIYGVSQTTGTGPYVELGTRTVSGSTTVNIPANSVITIYSYSGVNQEPMLTDWRPTPDYLTSPSSTTTLKVNATDAELDPLSYSWSIKSKPSNANPVFGSPLSSTTTVSGLTVGNYTFTVTVSDPTHTVSRDVFLNVYSTNQPPYPWELFPIGGGRHFVGKTLAINIGGQDVEGNAITYDTTLISKPSGSTATITNPTSTNPKILVVDKPGQYIFRVETRDSTSMRFDTVSVNVVSKGQFPPSITSATATQIGSGQVQLTSSATDADGEPLTYWWNLKSGPVNAKPIFYTPGYSNTLVTNLTSGNYVFTVTAIDETNFSKRDASISVIQTSTPFCGNNIIEPGEQCDTGNSRGLCPAICSTNCILNSCTPQSNPFLVAYNFSENSGTTTADYSGNNRAGTLTAAAWVPGKYGSALTFSPFQNSKVVVSDFAPPSSITMEAWIYPTDTADDRVIISKTLAEYEMRITGVFKKLQAGIGTARLLDGNLDFGNGANLNQWYHYAFTYDNATGDTRLYRNGILVNSSFNAGVVPTDSPLPLTIGRSAADFGSFSGVIDDVRIWSIARTQSQIQLDMGAISCVDSVWTPSETTLCGVVTQVSDCGNTRNISGGLQCFIGETCTNNNCVRISANNTTIPPATNPGTGGGGGGGGSGGSSVPTSRTPSITQTKSLNQAGPEVINILNFNPETGVRFIELRVIGETQNIGITVSKYDHLPEIISVKKPGKVYKYLQIEITDSYTNLESALISSRIEKSWIEENHLNKEDIALFKFNEASEKWEELPTTFTEEDSNYNYYNTEVHGFSYFLIGQKATPLDTLGWKTVIALIILILVLSFIIYKIIMKPKKIALHIPPLPDDSSNEFS